MKTSLTSAFRWTVLTSAWALGLHLQSEAVAEQQQLTIRRPAAPPPGLIRIESPASPAPKVAAATLGGGALKPLPGARLQVSDSLRPQQFTVAPSGVLTLAPQHSLGAAGKLPAFGAAPPLGPLMRTVPAADGDLPLLQEGARLLVNVPAGIYQVTLEALSSSGLGRKPLETLHLDGTPQVVTFAAPTAAAVTSLRARGSRQNKFAAGQWQGTTGFFWHEEPQPEVAAPAKPAGSSGVNRLGAGNVFIGRAFINLDFQAIPIMSIGAISNRAAFGNVIFGDALAVNSTASISAFTNSAATFAAASAPASIAAPVAAATPAADPAEAVESDIWKVIGERLFFFNQYRGLQVFSLKDPAHPVKTGAVRMASVGEQFYALDAAGASLALLTACNTRKHNTGSAVNLLSVSAEGRPAIVGSLPLDGSIIESRLLGTRLYVLLCAGSKDNTSAGLTVAGFDLAKPAAPVDLGRVALPGGDWVEFQAAGNFLMVAASKNGGCRDDDGAGMWDAASPNNLSVVSVSGDGRPRLIKTVTTKGYLSDQFNMNISGDTLTAVSQSWVPGGCTEPWVFYLWKRQTWVETFSVSSLGKEPLASLKIDKADGEVIHATRFDGDRLYVVTFHVTDPLFIIDLKDPAKLKVTGELLTPGWSSFIEPQGDRLLTVGIEDWRVFVSWFDVSDATAPKLLSRVYPASGSTWSEANYDHKAVNWVKDEHKAFVPFQMSSGGGMISATQVVNVARDEITLGIAIENKGTARRGTVVRDSLVSISGRQMVITTNPDVGEPKEIAWLELSWPVDRVAALGSHLMQVEDGSTSSFWGLLDTSTGEAVVRLSSRDDPDTILDSVSLGRGTVAGITSAAGRIYVAQFVPSAGLAAPQLRTWSLAVDGAGKIQKVSDASAAIDPALEWRLNVGGTQPLWAADGILVWHVPVRPGAGDIGYIGYPVFGGILQPSLSLNVVSGNAVPPRSGLCALEFPVAVGLDGRLAGSAAVEVQTPADGTVVSVDKAFADGGFVFFSAQRGVTRYSSNLGCTNGGGIVAIPGSVSLSGYTCSLHVLDFREGVVPVVRDPVSIAGHLLAVAAVDKDGAYLIASRDAGFNYGRNLFQKHLTSLAYDGVRASEVDSLDTDRWTVQDSAGGRLYLATLSAETATAPLAATVNTLSLDASTGLLHWDAKGWQLASAPFSLKVVGSLLLASTWGDLEVAEIEGGGSLKPRASLDLPTTLWYDVERAAPDPDPSGLWLPAGDYGTEHFSFGK